MSTIYAVGNTFADFPRFLANFPQSANHCQLETQAKQDLRFTWQLAAPTAHAKLPTDVNPCQHWFFYPSPVGENSPSYYVGEGTTVPSDLRKSLPGEVDHGHHVNATILTLDLGTQTGWALHDRSGSIISGSESFKPQRFEGGGMRFLRFKRWLTEIKQSADWIDAVFFEEVRRHAGIDAAHAYGGFMAQLTAWCEHHQIPYQGVPVGTIKKHATGKGNASKEEMMAAVSAKGFSPIDDNEADALALLDWAIATQSWEVLA
jgi:Holliday junction resolvasome RuvABC endonuclease subunit